MRRPNPYRETEQLIEIGNTFTKFDHRRRGGVPSPPAEAQTGKRQLKASLNEGLCLTGELR